MKISRGARASGKTTKMLMQGLIQALNGKNVICIGKNILAVKRIQEQLGHLCFVIGINKSLVNKFIFLTEEEVRRGDTLGLHPSLYCMTIMTTVDCL